MNGEDRKAIETLVPYMRSIPGKLQKLLSQILQVRKAYRGESTGLSEYKATLEAELDKLEHMGRNLTYFAGMLKGIMDDPDALDDICTLLESNDTYSKTLFLLNELAQNKEALEDVYVFLKTFSLDD